MSGVWWRWRSVNDASGGVIFAAADFSAMGNEDGVEDIYCSGWPVRYFAGHLITPAVNLQIINVSHVWHCCVRFAAANQGLGMSRRAKQK